MSVVFFNDKTYSDKHLIWKHDLRRTAPYPPLIEEISALVAHPYVFIINDNQSLLLWSDDVEKVVEMSLIIKHSNARYISLNILASVHETTTIIQKADKNTVWMEIIDHYVCRKYYMPAV